MEKEREMKGTYWPRATERGLRQASGRKKNGKGQENDQPEPQWKIHLGRRSVRRIKVAGEVWDTWQLVDRQMKGKGKEHDGPEPQRKG